MPPCAFVPSKTMVPEGVALLQKRLPTTLPGMAGISEIEWTSSGNRIFNSTQQGAYYKYCWIACFRVFKLGSAPASMLLIVPPIHSGRSFNLFIPLRKGSICTMPSDETRSVERPKSSALKTYAGFIRVFGVLYGRGKTIKVGIKTCTVWTR